MKKGLITIVAMAAVFFFAANAFSAGLKGDFDLDGDVDAEDLAVFSKNFGKADGACTDNDNCLPVYYCAKEPGDCEGLGECMPRPTICPDVWDPVCGCDGNTYGNDCEAAAAGVNVDSEGECRTKHCWDNGMCETDEYCLFEPCAVETGICVPRPEVCLYIYDPVCGCDGRTYSNACDAAANGVSIDYKGECTP